MLIVKLMFVKFILPLFVKLNIVEFENPCITPNEGMVAVNDGDLASTIAVNVAFNCLSAK